MLTSRQPAGRGAQPGGTTVCCDDVSQVPFDCTPCLSLAEPLMIPRPDGTAEDDGAVLSVVTGADGRSFLLVLDAGSFEEVARADLDFTIPYQFHGEC